MTGLRDVTRRVHWGALAAELVVVVVGIALGLWVDDWRQARADRVAEQGYLAALEDDLEETRRQVARSIHAEELARDGLRATLELLDGPASPTAVDSLRPVVGWVAANADYRPADATYRELVQAGTLQVIRPEIRRLLTRLDAANRNVESMVDYDVQQFHGIVEPLLVHGALNYGAEGGSPLRMTPGGPPSDLRALWGDRAFWNVASLRLETAEIFLLSGRLPRLNAVADSTLAAVRAARNEP